MSRSAPRWFLLSLAGIALLTAFGPPERSLGTNVRVVYLHGAWVWVALLAFLAAGMTGLLGLIAARPGWRRWSRTLGRTGLFFWITYLPLSLWAMQANWNGLFLAEPRWRLAVAFAIGGLVLQAGLALLEDLRWTAAGNLFFALTLFLALGTTPNVMHPSSPILQSDALRIQLYFSALVGLTGFAAWQFARWGLAE